MASREKIVGLDGNPVDPHSFKKTGSGGGGGGPTMEDIARRVGVLESDMKSARDDLSEIKATFATRDGLNDVRLEIERVRSEMHSLGRQMIMWNIGTILTSAGLVFAIMRFLPAT
ncbi:hypothetical protein [Halomonas sp. C22]|uniref:hypothetical protein n=1 Tax=Halomonas sp. C22 TaxID=2580567 RepID=UPI0011A09ED6|nr:hypothetical protein [Halomonas sp. C22]